jgi:hypothetical protein
MPPTYTTSLSPFGDLEVTYDGIVYTLEVDGDTIEITQDDHWATNGYWNGHTIEAGAALGHNLNDPDETQAVYDVLDEALRNHLSSL